MERGLNCYETIVYASATKDEPQIRTFDGGVVWAQTPELAQEILYRSGQGYKIVSAVWDFKEGLWIDIKNPLKAFIETYFDEYKD